MTLAERLRADAAALVWMLGEARTRRRVSRVALVGLAADLLVFATEAEALEGVEADVRTAALEIIVGRKTA